MATQVTMNQVSTEKVDFISTSLDKIYHEAKDLNNEIISIDKNELALDDEHVTVDELGIIYCGKLFGCYERMVMGFAPNYIPYTVVLQDKAMSFDIVGEIMNHILNLSSIMTNLSKPMQKIANKFINLTQDFMNVVHDASRE